MDSLRNEIRDSLCRANSLLLQYAGLVSMGIPGMVKDGEMTAAQDALDRAKISTETADGVLELLKKWRQDEFPIDAPAPLLPGEEPVVLPVVPDKRRLRAKSGSERTSSGALTPKFFSDEILKVLYDAGGKMTSSAAQNRLYALHEHRLTPADKVKVAGKHIKYKHNTMNAVYNLTKAGLLVRQDDTLTMTADAINYVETVLLKGAGK